jgi:hypothetical protein
MEFAEHGARRTVCRHRRHRSLFWRSAFSKLSKKRRIRFAPPHRVFEPKLSEQRVYDDLYRLFSSIYFAFGEKRAEMGDVLPALIRISEFQPNKAAPR